MTFAIAKSWQNGNVAIIILMSNHLRIRNAYKPSRSVMIVSRFVRRVVLRNWYYRPKDPYAAASGRYLFRCDLSGTRCSAYTSHTTTLHFTIYNVPNRGKTSFQAKDDQDWSMILRTTHFGLYLIKANDRKNMLKVLFTKKNSAVWLNKMTLNLKNF